MIPIQSIQSVHNKTTVIAAELYIFKSLCSMLSGFVGDSCIEFVGGNAGEIVGLIERLLLGDVVGYFVGCIDGDIVGINIGDIVVISDELLVGNVVGCIVGGFDGV